MLSRLRPTWVHVADETRQWSDIEGCDIPTMAGGAFRKGRGWVKWARKPSPRIRRQERVVAAEWLVFTDGVTGISVTTNSDDYEWSFHVGANPVGHLYLSFGGFVPAPKVTREPPYEGRTISLTFHEGTLHWQLWQDPHRWDSKTPRWRNGSFNVADWVLGRPVYETETIRTDVDVPVPMPEGQYLATFELERCTWRRPRRTFLGFGDQTILRFDVTFDPPLGKTNRASFSTRTGELWQGVAACVEMGLRSRNRKSARGDRLLPRP